MSAAYAPAPERPSAPAPRWARRVALAVVVCVLPSALWRMSVVVTGPWCDPELSTFEKKWPSSPLEQPYLVFLSLLQVSAGLAAFGLVERWGEVAPRWVPFVGGKTLSVRAVVTAAAIGTAMLFLIEGYGILNSIFEFRPPHEEPSCVMPKSGARVTLLKVLYAPLLVWPALMAVLTVAYWRRRTRPAAQD